MKQMSQYIKNECMLANNDLLLQVNGLQKRFGDVVALKNADFCLRKGSVHALCGSNGAGKSTFLSLLMGFQQPDAGEIYIKGQRCQFDNPRQALAAGIAIVQQELSGIQDLTVAENIYLGSEPGRFGMMDYRQLNQRAQALLTELNFPLKATEKMRHLSVAQQQLAEIAKALSHENADIIIMDEPTSALGEKDAQKLFASIQHLASLGKGIIYVSHRLSEIFQIADTCTVFRDGTYITEGAIADIPRDKLIELIVGTEIENEFVKNNQPDDEIIFQVNQLNWKDKIQDISLSLRSGEILGIYGLMGAGRSELLDLIFGINHADRGEMSVFGKPLKKHNPATAIKSGIAYVTEDRKATGLVLSSPVSENINIASFKAISSWFIINKRRYEQRTHEMIKLFNVKTNSTEQLVIDLSGGNQQKIVLGRWALIEPVILLLDEPTRGIDVGAKKEIYKFMSDFAVQGKGIIMVSSELSEIIGMSDRIIVFNKGRVVAELPQHEATQATLMALAT